jgi:hypothetical protein
MWREKGGILPVSVLNLASHCDVLPQRVWPRPVFVNGNASVPVTASAIQSWHFSRLLLSWNGAGRAADR